MDYLGDFGALTGKGGFDPIAMYKAVVDISKALQNPYADSKGFKQNIADDSAKLAALLSQNPYTPPPLEALNPKDTVLASVYTGLKSKDEQQLFDTMKYLSDGYSSTDYTDQKALESNLLENQMLSMDSDMVKPLVEQIMHPTLEGLLSLGQGALLFGAMYAISAMYRLKSSSAYESDKAFHRMNKVDATEWLGNGNPDVWEIASNGDGKGIAEKMGDSIQMEMKEQKKAKDDLFIKDMNLSSTAGNPKYRPPQDLGPGGSQPKFETDILYQQGNIEDIFDKVKKRLIAELKDRTTIQILPPYSNIATAGNNGGYTDINRAIYYGETDQSSSVNQPTAIGGVSDSVINHNNPLDPNNFWDPSGVQPTFPVFGTPYNPQTLAITTNMNTNTEFGPDGPIDVDNQNLSMFNGTSWEYNPTPKRATMFKGWGILKEDKKTWEPDPLNTFTMQTPFSEYVKKTALANNKFAKGGSQPPGTVKFFIEKLHGVHNDGITSNGRNPVTSNTNPAELDNRMVFAAYIDNYSESYSPSWSSYEFIGRGEGLPIYKMTTRTLNISFNIIADYSLDMLAGMALLYKQLGYDNHYEGQLDAIINSKQDWGLGYVGVPSYDENSGKGEIRVGAHIPGKYSDTTESLWQKVTFMAQCCYAHYRKDGKMKEQPMIRLRLADFYDVTGYIESLTVDSNEFENSFDLNETVLGNIPFGVKVTMSMKVLHDAEPNSSFMQFYHRREMDGNGVTDGDLIAHRIVGGNVATGLKIKSPMSFAGAITNEKLTDTPTSLKNGDVTALTNGLQNFQSTFANVKNMGINIKDTERKNALQKAMKSYVKVSDMADQLASRYCTKLNKPNGMPGDITAFSTTDKSSNSNSTVNFNPSQIDQVKQNTADKKQAKTLKDILS